MSWDTEIKGYFGRHKPSVTEIHTQRTDQIVKYCNECKQTWESHFCNNRGVVTEYYGSSIPSIGKDRKNCPKCESIKASELVKYQGV